MKKIKAEIKKIFEICVENLRNLRSRFLKTFFILLNMKLKIDKESDALYFRLDDDEIVESEEVQPGIVLDFDENGRVIGIEILSLSTRFSPEKLRIMQFETV